jgi:uncharacterized protein (DUF486 family)
VTCQSLAYYGNLAGFIFRIGFQRNEHRSPVARRIPGAPDDHLKIIMRTVILLTISNLFMTVAWYGHLKYKNRPLIIAILLSWGVALFEYIFQVPANRLGYGQFTLTQLKVIQECITLAVFTGFALVVFREPVRWNYLLSYLCIVGAVYFAFRN